MSLACELKTPPLCGSRCGDQQKRMSSCGFEDFVARGRGRSGAHERGRVGDETEPPVPVKLAPGVAVLGDPLSDRIEGSWASELDGFSGDESCDFEVAESAVMVKVRD